MADTNPEIGKSSSENLLDFQIEELDASEFDLPSVETPQTLESILNEPDEESVLDYDELDFPVLSKLKSDSFESSSISSQDSFLVEKLKKKKKKPTLFEIHGSVLRQSILKNLSAQVLSAADRVDAGSPTALAVSALIAIGTSHGLVLVFDSKQALKWCLGSTAVGSQYGSVSALSFNRDCSRLLSGFAKGQITMWDLTNGKLIRTIADAHPPGTSVLHVKFTDSPVIAVCSDSGGSVFELEFKRLIGVRSWESKCLFSGSRGEVCVIEPLHMNYTIKDHPMQDVSILAMATFSKVLLVILKPQLKVVFTHPLKGDASTLPLLAWQFVIIQVSEKDRVIDPVLAFARDTTIYFYQVVCSSAQDVKCSGLQKLQVPYKLLNLKWMNPRTIVTLDTTEKFHVIDVRSEEVLEVVDIADIQLVYGTSHFKSLATGGNVSQALAYAGDAACYQTVLSQNSQLFVLGTKSVSYYSLRNWKERIEVLVKQNHYKEALSLAHSFYEGRAKAVVGLTGSPKQRKEIVSELMLDILFEYVDLSMTQLCPDKGRIEELEEYYQNIVPVCVDYCLYLNRIDILFGRIFDRFSVDMIAKMTFLECLEPYIINDKVTSIPPAIMQEFVDHFESRGMLESVEACVIHLDITSLDIHQVVSLCWCHGLYDAIIYVYNKGMNDYVSPLEQLLAQLISAHSTGKQLTDNQIRLGNKLLVYVSCCLAGRAYPLGDIPEDIVLRVKQEVLKCITCIHTLKPEEDEPVFPYLRALLQFDTREFLNVLSIAFEEPEFSTDEGITERQRVIDILLQVMVKGSGFSLSQVGTLFTFLARQMARHPNAIHVNRDHFEQVLEFLSNPDDEIRHEERQQALIELLYAGGLQQFDEERLLQLAQNAKFYRVCEILYQKKRQFGKILSCYLMDEYRKQEAFNYISSIINSNNYTDEEKRNLKEEALIHLEDLLTMDCKQTAEVVLCLTNSLQDIVKKLKSKPQILFDFLQGVISYRDSSGSALYVEKQVTLEPSVIELYIELLCQYKPTEVYNFIITNEGYRLEETLQICRQFNMSEATTFLLEKAGDIEGAFAIILQHLQSKIKTLTGAILSQSNIGKDLSVSFHEVQAVLLVVIQLCQRNSNKMDEIGREGLWFPLLETMMTPQRKFKDFSNKKIVEDFKEWTHHVLNSMMGYIPLPAILQKIMQDPAYNTGKFGEVKDLVLGMLETYNYEQTLMQTCKTLLSHDLHIHLRGLRNVAIKGFVPKREVCFLCNKMFQTMSDLENIVVFRCGHTYHNSCLRAGGSVHMIDGEEIWACYICSSKRQGRSGQIHFKKSLSCVGTEKGKHNKNKNLDSQNLATYESIKKSLRTPARLSILKELSRPDSEKSSFDKSSGIFQNERFALHLSAPRIQTL